MPRIINLAGQFDGSQTCLDGFLTVAMMLVYLGSIGQRPDLKGHVSVTSSDGQGTGEGLLGIIVFTPLLTQE